MPRAFRVLLESSGDVGLAVSACWSALHFLWLHAQREL